MPIGGIDGNIDDTIKQIIWFFVGVVCMVIMTFIDYDILGKFWLPIYIILLLSLIGVLFTEPINGATSWYNFGGVSLQPSEFAKLGVIIGIRKANRLL